MNELFCITIVNNFVNSVSVFFTVGHDGLRITSVAGAAGGSYDRRFREAKVDQISDQYLLYVSSRNPFIDRKTAVLTKHTSFFFLA